MGVLASFTLFAQTKPYGTGCKLDLERYKQVPLKPTLMRGDFMALPTQKSLRKYAPIARNQGLYGNCVGWSTAYAARTIMLAQKLGWTSSLIINENAFSPFFVYEKAKSNQDVDCKEGTNLPVALEIMKEFGTLKLKEFHEVCGQPITQQHIERAKEYRITDYQRLFEHNSPNKVQLVKKSLAEDKPVVVGIQCCTESFLYANGKDTWKLQSTDNPSPDGGHAVTVVSYDDNKNGGSFEIMNSWGTKWGNEGFIWITYEDFNRYCFEAYEMTLEPEKEIKLASEIKFSLLEGTEMKVTMKSKGYYEMQRPYPSGTMYKMTIKNEEPAYVYVLSTDLSYNIQQLFPPNNKTSAYLGYRGSNIAIPDEDHYFMLDDQVGTDYLCILYSSDRLPIEEILIKFQNTQGNFSQRLSKALENYAIDLQDGQYFSHDKINFSIKNNSKKQIVVPIVVAIQHIK
ncbi:MAG: DUF4384 domain-containing protein [Microscillaceae bacterium]|nr:DUF4384 domain-containing protein [Microscillaceae bacterium]MDW8460521.1 C1 family peptidase [Cytophagales bacterium]